jgi:hypothetical protein
MSKINAPTAIATALFVRGERRNKRKLLLSALS